MDRRIQRTQEAIMSALLELIGEKDFDKITINQIADRANVNRGTIYLHYLDKFDLLNKCIDINLDKLFEHCRNANNSSHYFSKSSILLTFEYLEQNSFFYITLLKNKGVPNFGKRLQDKMIQGLREQIDRGNIKPIMKKDILVQFLASAAVGILEWWFTHDMPYPAEEITDEFWELLQRNQLIP